MTQSMFDYLKEFTKTYQSFADHDIVRRETACLKVQYPFILKSYETGDLFAGRIKHAPIGISPQMGEGYGYYLLEDDFKTLIQEHSWSDAEQQKLNHLLAFWQKENTPRKIREAYPENMAAVFPSDGWYTESGIAFPLYRMSGSHLDYDTLLQSGIPGLQARIQKKTDAAANRDTQILYTAMLNALQLLVDVITDYAKEAKTQMESGQGEHWKKIHDNLTHISKQKPETLHQAMQLMYLYNVMSGSVNYGRMDIYLGDFLAADLSAGRLTEAEAVNMIKSLWIMMNQRESDHVWKFDSRVILGGKGRRNESNADQFARLAMEATRQVKDIIPQLTLRFYDGQNPDLYKQALDVIGTGNPYPMLYNDDVNIPSAKAAFDIPEEDAADCIPFGCGEYVIYHKSFGTPSGVINMLQALSVTLHKGIDKMTGKPQGLPAHEFGPFETFDDLYKAYQKQIEFHVRYLADQEMLEYEITGKTLPFLFMSMLFDDCIDRGKALFEGGVRYLGGTLETYGNSNTADSLYAIKKAVYEDKKFTLDELTTMLDANFEGYEAEQRYLQNLPKYGNDHAEADAMLVDVDRHICEVTRNQRDRTGLHNYMVVIINNHANTLLGNFTPASADGRNARDTLNNGNAPASGSDKNGVTAFLNSIVKPDTRIHAGAVQNMKFSNDLFASHRDKLEMLLDTYFENGGAQAMLTVLGRGDLEKAMAHPEQYQNLIVRVGGFSARFVELDQGVQEEILARTLY